MSDTEKVVAALTGADEELRREIILDIGRFTVPLFAMTGKDIELAGTGTLFTRGGAYFILTAAHVWEEKLRPSNKVGIGMKPDINHRFTIPAQALVACSPPHPTPWDRRGPDIAFIRIPFEHLGSMKARKPFYSPAVDEAVAQGDRIEVYVLMGTPHVLGTFSPGYAYVQVNGRFIWDKILYSEGDGQDYFDVEIDTSLPGTPETWGGTSGGGLWAVHAYCERSTGKIEWARGLQGLAFWEEPVGSDRVVIRCHGPRSIAGAISSVLGGSGGRASS